MFIPMIKKIIKKKTKMRNVKMVVPKKNEAVKHLRDILESKQKYAPRNINMDAFFKEVSKEIATGKTYSPEEKVSLTQALVDHSPSVDQVIDFVTNSTEAMCAETLLHNIRSTSGSVIGTMLENDVVIPTPLFDQWMKNVGDRYSYFPIETLVDHLIAKNMLEKILPYEKDLTSLRKSSELIKKVYGALGDKAKCWPEAINHLIEQQRFSYAGEIYNKIPVEFRAELLTKACETGYLPNFIEKTSPEWFAPEEIAQMEERVLTFTRVENIQKYTAQFKPKDRQKFKDAIQKIVDPKPEDMLDMVLDGKMSARDYERRMAYKTGDHHPMMPFGPFGMYGDRY